MLVLWLSFSSQVSADFVINGGFENGDFNGWTLSGDPSVNFVQGGFVHTGDYAAWFGETGDLGHLTQTLPTTAGTSYILSFWFAGSGDDPSEFTASIGGSTLLDLVNPPFNVDYIQYAFTFTACYLHR